MPLNKDADGRRWVEMEFLVPGILSRCGMPSPRVPG